jgi:hypothetical protein
MAKKTNINQYIHDCQDFVMIMSKTVLSKASFQECFCCYTLSTPHTSLSTELTLQTQAAIQKNIT